MSNIIQPITAFAVVAGTKPGQTIARSRGELGSGYYAFLDVQDALQEAERTGPAAKVATISIPMYETKAPRSSLASHQVMCMDIDGDYHGRLHFASKMYRLERVVQAGIMGGLRSFFDAAVMELRKPKAEPPWNNSGEVTGQAVIEWARSNGPAWMHPDRVVSAVLSGALYDGISGRVASRGGASVPMVMFFKAPPIADVVSQSEWRGQSAHDVAPRSPGVSQASTDDFIEATTEQVAARVNLGRMIELFGANLYGRDLPEVCVRELMQNSFDAVKGALAQGRIAPGEGVINIHLDPIRRSIRMVDNGGGMSIETVREAFLQIAGTDKTGLAAIDRSGGFGIAKMAFLFGSDRLRLSTVRDGVETSLKTTGLELLEGRASLSQRSTGKPSGTTVEVIIPRAHVKGDGTVEPISFPDSSYSLRALTSPLLGDVAIQLKIGARDSELLPNGRFFPMAHCPKVTTVEFPWGEVDVHVGAREEFAYSAKHSVLGAGLTQFEPRISEDGSPWGSLLPRSVILNVKSAVDPAARDYPFSKSRDGWGHQIEQNAADLYNLVRAIHLAEEGVRVADQYANFAQMPLKVADQCSFKAIDISGDVHPGIKLDPNARLRIEGNRLMQAGVHLLSLPRVGSPMSGPLLAGSVVEPSEFRPSGPLLHVVGGADRFVKAVAEKAGLSQPAVRAALTELGNEIYGFRVALEKVAGEEDYAKAPRICGITISMEHRGVYIWKPAEGFFLSPVPATERTSAGMAHGWVHALMHEATHRAAAKHDERFTLHLADLHGKFEDANPGHYGRMVKTLTKFVEKNQRLLAAMKDVARDPNSANSSDSIEVNAALRTPGRDLRHSSGVPQAHRGHAGRPGSEGRGAEASGDGGGSGRDRRTVRSAVDLNRTNRAGRGR